MAALQKEKTRTRPSSRRQLRCTRPTWCSSRSKEMRSSSSSKRRSRRRRLPLLLPAAEATDASDAAQAAPSETAPDAAAADAEAAAAVAPASQQAAIEAAVAEAQRQFDEVKGAARGGEGADRLGARQASAKRPRTSSRRCVPHRPRCSSATRRLRSSRRSSPRTTSRPSRRRCRSGWLAAPARLVAVAVTPTWRLCARAWRSWSCNCRRPRRASASSRHSCGECPRRGRGASQGGARRRAASAAGALEAKYAAASSNLGASGASGDVEAAVQERLKALEGRAGGGGAGRDCGRRLCARGGAQDAARRQRQGALRGGQERGQPAQHAHDQAEGQQDRQAHRRDRCAQGRGAGEHRGGRSTAHGSCGPHPRCRPSRACLDAAVHRLDAAAHAVVRQAPPRRAPSRGPSPPARRPARPRPSPRSAARPSAGRGGTRIARGGAAQAGAKRKLSAQGLATAQPDAQQGGAKKPRAAGAPVAVRKPGPGNTQGGQQG
ncbi:hypothetical protein L1887_61150 [Cichorium endivia]|nr:hypothetical protein L1887_61150 [Cichorium endivia]